MINPLLFIPRPASPHTGSPLRIAVLLCSLLIFFTAPGSVLQALVLQGDDVSVRYAAPQETAAKEVVRLYPAVQRELRRALPWPIDFSTTFLLLTEGQLERIAESRLVAALALPGRNLVLLDMSKMSKHAFVLETTMKHELCHLLLHRYIQQDHLPKWLDEGVCQWVSSGLAEIVMEGKGSSLEEAVLAGRLLPLNQLVDHFPSEDRLMKLAYEQSESVVKYTSETYGSDKLIQLLDQLRRGKPFESSVKESLGVDFAELESNWQRSLKKQQTWFLYVSIHLYEIIFLAAALLTVGGFFRMIYLRKKRCNDEAEE